MRSNTNFTLKPIFVNMKKLILLLLFLLPLCASAKKYSLNYNKGITAIVNKSEADVELIYSPTDVTKVVYSSSEIEAPLRFSMSASGCLTITKARKNNYKVSAVKIYHNSYITSITNSGTGDVSAKQVNAPVDMEIKNSGTGDVDIDRINLKTLTIRNSGTGDVDIDSGKVNRLIINNTGTGDVEAKVKSAECSISNSGTGDVTGVRASYNKMQLSNCGTGKIAIKRQKTSGDLQISSECSRNIRFVK